MSRKTIRSEHTSLKSKISMFFYETNRIIREKILGENYTPLGSKLNKRTKEQIFIWSMLAIPIAHFLVFWVYVNFDSILLAFRNIDYAAGGEEYWTLENFETVFKMFKGEVAGINLSHYGLNTLKFWLLGTVWGISHSVLLTYVLHKKLRGYKFFRVVLYLPSIICAVVIAGIFESFISPNGVVGYLLTNVFHWERVPAWFQESEYATWTLLFYSFFFGFAGSYVLLSGAMAKIPTELTEAAMIDGVGMWRELWNIDIPLMWPTLSMIIVSSVAGFFGASGAILLFTPRLSSTWTFGYWMFDQVRSYQSYYVTSALGLVFTIVSFPVVMGVRKLVLKIYNYEA